jgi:UDP-N-acetylmuramoyl-tripeptide--D-alanyl-D-alanine ligase
MEVSTSPDGVLVINDSYNANPDSMRAALEALADIARRRGRGRVVAVLGDMRELGAASRAEHEALGRFAAGLGVDLLVSVGEAAAPVAEAARQEAGWAGRAEVTADQDEALRTVEAELREGDAVLVKASRAAGLEGLAAALAAGRDAGARREVSG